MVAGVRSSSVISRTLTNVNRSVISHVRDSPDEVPVEKTRKCLCGFLEILCTNFPFKNKVYVASSLKKVKLAIVGRSIVHSLLQTAV